MVRNILILLVFTLAMTACTDKDIGHNEPPVADFWYSDEIDRFVLASTVTDMDSNVEEFSYQWLSNSPLIKIEDPEKRVTSFFITEVSEAVEVDIKHIVYDGQSYDTIIKTIALPVFTMCRQLGLGYVLNKEHSNNVDYKWYIDQGDTGKYSLVNCAPSVVTMALKWCDENFDKTTVDARNRYPWDGLEWHTSIMFRYLNDYKAKNYAVSPVNTSVIVDELEAGHIIILCMDMYNITDAICERWRVGKFYKKEVAGGGHAILVKGYKKVDGKFFYEVYDPWSLGRRYADGTFKGEDRYYLSQEVDFACNRYWNYALIISRDKTKSSRGIDSSQIKHRYVN